MFLSECLRRIFACIFTCLSVLVHSFHRLMNSINWSSPRVWVSIAQLVEHYRANTEATGWNPVEAPKNLTFFFRATSQLLKFRFNCRRRSHIHFIYMFMSQENDEINTTYCLNYFKAVLKSCFSIRKWEENRSGGA